MHVVLTVQFTINLTLAGSVTMVATSLDSDHFVHLRATPKSTSTEYNFIIASMYGSSRSQTPTPFLYTTTSI